MRVRPGLQRGGEECRLSRHAGSSVILFNAWIVPAAANAGDAESGQEARTVGSWKCRLERTLGTEDGLPPILREKYYGSPSAFTPESLLREARRQKSAAAEPVPSTCLLDPDGDIVSQLKREGRAKRHEAWVCYHTDLFLFDQDGITFGVVGCAVGASFAVLVAEELFASGCQLLISITSSGQLARLAAPPYFVLIDRALRDEGTSYHYLPPSTHSTLPQAMAEALEGAFDNLSVPVLRGATWTTDAPFRETSDAIAAMSKRGLLAVEMEAAALYAFATARGKPVICFAHVTNQMGQVEGDFEKGEANGAADGLKIVVATAQRLAPAPPT
ncbi:MAG: nucleoside phosphorylase [Hyphomicrobiales bacterium]|nr:nucleoside phosphorylase [Hyphomicrobiales bacterium]